MPNDPFTINKAKVRELDFVLIKRCFKDHKGELRYLGLPAKNLLELIAWKERSRIYRATQLNAYCDAIWFGRQIDSFERRIR